MRFVDFEPLFFSVVAVALVVAATVSIRGCQDYMVRSDKEAQLLIEKCGKACPGGMHKFTMAACECK